MIGIRHEWLLISRLRLTMGALALLLLLAGLGVASGLKEVERQHQTIARLAPLHEQDVEAVARQFGGGKAGDAAYYTYFYTWNAPSTSAFLALGLRDVAPFVLRIRALGLQAQIYDGENFNPELALPGRFDFSFVLIYLAPLFVIALMYDMVSGERQAGRLRLLLSLPASTGALWYRRIGLRLGLVLIGLLLPLVVGTLISGARPDVTVGAIFVTVSYVVFWFGVSLPIVTRNWRARTHAVALVSLWVMLTLVLPTVSQSLMNRAIPVSQSMDLMLAHRQNVHGAWEIPQEQTMQRFYRSHPEWKNAGPLPEGFQWRWYFAFHQLGDESVSDAVQAYRKGLLARQAWTDRLGWVLPAVGAQVALHRLADTDLPAQLSYQDRIAEYHTVIREFYYPYLFNDTLFDVADFAKRPDFSPFTGGQSMPSGWIWLLLPILLLGCVGAALTWKVIAGQRLQKIV